MDDHTEEYDLPTAEEFAKEYCGPRTNLETQAKDAAWVLYGELQKLRKIHSRCKPVKEDEESTSSDQTIDELETPTSKKKAVKNAETPQLSTAKQGKKSYKQFLQDQIKVVGTAGMIAMSTAVYSQSQAVYTQGAIVYEVVEKELPILGYLKGLLTGTVAFSVSDVIQNSTTSYQNATTKTPTAGVSNTTKAAAENAVIKGDKPVERTAEQTIAEAAVDPSLPEVKSLLEEGKKITDKQDILLQSTGGIETTVPTVINPASTTNPNP